LFRDTIDAKFFSFPFLFLFRVWSLLPRQFCSGLSNNLHFLAAELFQWILGIALFIAKGRQVARQDLTIFCRQAKLANLFLRDSAASIFIDELARDMTVASDS